MGRSWRGVGRRGVILMGYVLGRGSEGSLFGLIWGGVRIMWLDINLV